MHFGTVSLAGADARRPREVDPRHGAWMHGPPVEDQPVWQYSDVGGGAVARSRPRVSLAERERIAERLRWACADERLSLDTFAARLTTAYSARTTGELDALVEDIPEPGVLTRATLGAVTATSRWFWQVSAAWQEPRTRRLVLPTRPRVALGRSRRCDCVVAHDSVSRIHAHISFVGARWWLRDCDSTNGTYVNGWRVASSTEVRPGDELMVGEVRFILRAPSDRALHP